MRRPKIAVDRSAIARTMLPLALLLATASPALAQATDDRRFDWLESMKDPAAADWAAKRSAAALKTLLASPQAAKVLAEVRANAKVGAVPPPFVQPYSVLGARLARVTIDSRHPAGIIEIAPRGPNGPTGPWRTVLDIDALNVAEHEHYGSPVLNLSAACLPPEYRRCMITLGLGGSEIQRIREFDLETGKFVEGGFQFADAKTEFTWLGEDKLLVAQAVAGDTLKSGFPSTVRLWKRGTPYSEAAPVFQADPADFMFRVTGVGAGEKRKGLISAARASDRFETFIVDQDGKVTPTHLPASIPYPGNIGLNGGTSRYVAATTVEPATVRGKTYPEGTVFAYDSWDSTPALQKISVVYVPPKGTYFYDNQFGATYAKDRIYLVATRNLQPSLLAAAPGKHGWTVKTILTAARGESIVLWGGGLAADSVAVGIEGYLKPATIGLTDGDRCCVQITSRPATFDASRFTVDIRTAKAKDGALIDYYLVRPIHPKPGPVPTILTAYGGGGAVIRPSYAGALLDGGLISWLERGGAFGYAGIRGGGEKGTAWWKAGSGRLKANGIDDVAAVAADLIKTGFTTPAKLGFTGRSYGGLLASAIATRHPDLFGAILPGVPLVDTFPVAGGTPQLKATDNNIGDPNDPDDLKAMLGYMPFQNVRPGVKYPSILTVSSTSDDRVGPGPARRFTAKLEAAGATPLLIEGPTGGHLFPKATANPEAVAAEVMFFVDNLMR